MKKIIRTLAPPLLIILFIYAAISKLLTFSQFRGQLYLQPFPHLLADLLLYTLIPVEIFTAGLLCFESTQKAGLRLSVVLLAGFSGYIILALAHFWPRIPCSCGGILSHMSWGSHLIFNLFFIALGVTPLCMHQAPKSLN